MFCGIERWRRRLKARVLLSLFTKSYRTPGLLFRGYVVGVLCVIWTSGYDLVTVFYTTKERLTCPAGKPPLGDRWTAQLSATCAKTYTSPGLLFKGCTMVTGDNY